MKKALCKHYKKPKIQENKVKTNFFSFNPLDPDINLLSDYCGQCSGDGGCLDCAVPSDCDLMSC